MATGIRIGELIALAKAGGEAALGTLLEGLRGYLELLARVHIGRRLQGKADPADIVQEAFLEAHRNFPKFQGNSESQLAGWLRRILAGRLAKHVRRYFGTQGRDARLEQDLETEVDESSRSVASALAASASTPSGQASRREQAVLVAEALGRLPEDYREVLLLRHFDELTFPEIARRMRRTEDSVEKLWVRALARLRRTFGERS